MERKFTIDGRMPSLNDYTAACRSNKYVGAKMKSDETERVAWAIRQAKVPPVPKSEIADIHIAWIEPTSKRDHDNIAFAKKFILDALVDTGVLAGDGWECVGNFSDTFFFNRAHPRIEVLILTRPKD